MHKYIQKSSSMSLDTIKNKLIHVACIKEKGRGSIYLFLRQVDLGEYMWFKPDQNGAESKTDVHSHSIEEALRLGAKHWKKDNFRMINCGFRYTLPERDEHGTNALFYQMKDSYLSMNGIYFDEELKTNCIVHNASIESRDLLIQIQKAKF
jgi:hypothetical protein